jgi:hypothetical protein
MLHAQAHGWAVHEAFVEPLVECQMPAYFTSYAATDDRV